MKNAIGCKYTRTDKNGGYINEMLVGVLYNRFKGEIMHDVFKILKIT